MRDREVTHVLIILSGRFEAKGQAAMAIDRPEGDAAQAVRTWKPVLGLSDESGVPLAIPVPKARSSTSRSPIS